MTPIGARISGFVVIPGYACNFSCSHCSAESHKKADLSEREIRLVSDTIIDRGIKRIFFTGGEPFLYVRTMNKVLELVSSDRPLSITVTTNGAFASSSEKALETLGSLRKLDNIQLSYDRFHAEFLPEEKIAHLYEACRKLKKKFSVVLTLESPLDLRLVQLLRRVGDFPISVQKVLGFGSARRNGLEFRYPNFDRKVLSQYCPVRGLMAYVPSCGFTSCCVAHDLPPGRLKRFHPSVAAHMESEFYRIVFGFTLRGMMKELGITDMEFLPRHSARCRLCADLLSKQG